jgi:photosystem II stability/assembly factor-like uncharacterized protein
MKRKFGLCFPVWGSWRLRRRRVLPPSAGSGAAQPLVHLLQPRHRPIITFAHLVKLARRSSRMAIVIALVALTTASSAFAQVWRSMGPPGGDVQSLVSDPNHPNVLYLGTADGEIYTSTDDGAHWALAGRVGRRFNDVVAALIVDPRNSQRLYAGVWALNPADGGAVYASNDAGRTWYPLGLTGHAVRALAEAPSNPDILVAGALDGVFRSTDDGKTWARISPAGSYEIRNLDSVAIDPHDPGIVYAGTYHLPWKTVDAGKRWFPIHTGMIDDSDVFSIAIDPNHSNLVYLSSCSGIYRSYNGGLQWVKVQGIPTSARRTQVIVQDPLRRSTVYAGTTEGLWKTTNEGASWQRITPGNWIINALIVDPRKEGRLVVGTERLGILVSNDGGRTYQVSNDGFNHRQIAAVALDRAHPGRVLAILSDAPDPVVVTDDGGAHWRPLGSNLRWESVRQLYAAPDGWWAALGKGGLLTYDASRRSWVRSGDLVGEAAWTFQNGRLIKPNRRPLDLVVRDMAFSSDGWYAATAYGLLRSGDHGATWSEVRFAPLILPVESVAISPDGLQIWVATDHGLAFSQNGGRSWNWRDLPESAGTVVRLEITDPRSLLALTSRGLYISYDGGTNWARAAHGLPEVPVRDVAVAGKTMLASVVLGGLFISHDRGRTWLPVSGSIAEGKFPVVAAEPGSDLIYAASASNGLYAIHLGIPTGSKTVASSSDPPARQK